MNTNHTTLIVLSAAAAFGLYAMKGRRGAAGADDFDSWLYAHRGFHREPDAPENSLAAFRLAFEKGMGAELDVHLLKDGTLAILHDSDLKRMTGRDGVVEDLTGRQLKQIHLGNSRETIPTLGEVLKLCQGKVPLIIELKPWGGNVLPLCRSVWQELKDYEGLYCVESFHPQVVRWFRKNHPQVIRGQLSMDYIHERKDLTWLEAAAGTWLLTNLVTKPDFVAYRFSDRKQASNQICSRFWKMKHAAWTIHTMEELRIAREEGYWPIFENFDPVTGVRFEGASDT